MPDGSFGRVDSRVTQQGNLIWLAIHKADKLWILIRTHGPIWTAFYLLHFVGTRLLRAVEAYLIGIERQKFLTGPSTISSRYHTVEDNRKLWNAYDWTRGGDEWTLGAKSSRGLDPERWKASLIDELMLKFIIPGSVVLEIGPGAGRWTEVLRPLCDRLFLAEISEKALAVCRERFGEHSNVEYHLIEDDSLEFISDNEVDDIWSYDVFVHINPRDTERYIEDFRRILRPGGYALIHHPGSYESARDRTKSYRSYVDGSLVAHLVNKHGLELIDQNASLSHRKGDLISVIRKPTP